MSPVGWFHTAVAILALATGALLLARRKGTRPHRLLGWVYVLSMVGLNVTALTIYRLSGGFGPFHAAAIASLAIVLMGVLSALRRKPGWVERHYFWMTYSYVGLVAAAVSEVATRAPGAPFWWAVLAATVGVLGVGVHFVQRRARATLAPFRYLNSNTAS